jgi:hypothetical protein
MHKIEDLRKKENSFELFCASSLAEQREHNKITVQEAKKLQ